MLEFEILKIIEGRKKAPVASALLWGCSQCYRVGVGLRNFAYDKGLICAEKVPLPVISVGNIVAGGTGKTPFIKLLAEEVLKIGKVAILSRGYRSAIEKSDKVIRIDAHSISEECGDEPVFLARNLKKAMVFAGKSRLKSARVAKAQGAEIILLDDGMQHRKLARNLEIVVMDGSDLFGKGFYLPRGFLRDAPKRLRKADFIVVNFTGSEEEWCGLKTELKKYSSAPLIGVCLKVTNSSAIEGKKVGTFCGIARPHRFIKTVEGEGAKVVASLTTLDHVSFSHNDLSVFSEKCKMQGADILVCTEKDAIKFTTDFGLCLPIISLKTELKIFSGEAYFEDLLQKVKVLWSDYHER